MENKYFNSKGMNEKGEFVFDKFLILFLLFLFAMPFFIGLVSTAPQGPNSITVVSNSSKGNTSALVWNVSGGYITTVVINATTQNVRWKAMVGNVTGKLTLDDAVGSTIFDWSLSTIAGEIYATRNSTTPDWTNIRCSNLTLLENESKFMSHSSADDNISRTFNKTGAGTHASFTVGTTTISANTCPSLNTYVSNSSQDSDFEEIALTDSTNFTIGGQIIYATIIETDLNGYNNRSHDFQMIVPENGSATWTSAIAYYIYAELS